MTRHDSWLDMYEAPVASGGFEDDDEDVDDEEIDDLTMMKTTISISTKTIRGDDDDDLEEETTTIPTTKTISSARALARNARRAGMDIDGEFGLHLMLDGYGASRRSSRTRAHLPRPRGVPAPLVL